MVVVRMVHASSSSKCTFSKPLYNTTHITSISEYTEQPCTDPLVLVSRNNSNDSSCSRRDGGGGVNDGLLNVILRV